MGSAMLDIQALSPPQQGAALLAFMVNPESARDRAAWLELHEDVAGAASVFDQVRALPHGQRLSTWEGLATALSTAPLETRQELVADARELLRVGGRVSKARKLLWVCMRFVLGGQAVSATQAQGAAPRLPDRLDVTQALAACCFAAWISDCVPQPELTVDLSQALSVNERWWQAVTSPWREQHGDKALGLPAREKVDVDLALRSLRVLQDLPSEHAAGLLAQWAHAALDVLPEATPLHPSAAEVLRVAANLLNVSMPQALSSVYHDVPTVVAAADEDDQLSAITVPLPMLPVLDVVSQAVPAPPTASPPPLPPAPAREAVSLAAVGPKSPPAPAAVNVFSASAPAPLLPVSAPVPLFPASPPARTEPIPLSPMDRPFSMPSRPAEVAFVFKASLIHLPSDPDYAGSESPDDGSNEPVPPSPSPKRSSP
jgi:hypothetical protein